MIHLNTAGAGLPSQATLDAMRAYLEQERAFGSYETEQCTGGLTSVRTTLAGLLHAEVSDVALFDSGTRAWTTCVHALRRLPRGATVWTTPYEYAGNVLSLQNLCRRDDLHLQVIPLDAAGDLDVAWMSRHATPSLALVSVVHVPSGVGLRLPVEEIGRLLREEAPNALYVVDACQSVGQLPVDVAAIGCDLLTAAGRKFLCGPRGTGFAVATSRWRERLGDHQLDLHAAVVTGLSTHTLTAAAEACRLETSELPLAAFHGLEVAVREAMSASVDMRPLVDELVARLRSHRGLQVLRPGTRHSRIVSFTSGMDARELVQRLRAAGINTWCIDGRHTPLYLPAQGVAHAVRVSLHHYNTLDDVVRLDEYIRSLEDA
jgi:selenocysteine lyase/cysteine desulfurase